MIDKALLRVVTNEGMSRVVTLVVVVGVALTAGACGTVATSAPTTVAHPATTESATTAIPATT